MIRQFRQATLTFILSVGLLLGSLFATPLGATAADYNQTQQESQSYDSQSGDEQPPYEQTKQTQGTDSYTSDYTEQHTNQSSAPTQQSNQDGANEQQGTHVSSPIGG